jgi:hypothetical protein
MATRALQFVSADRHARIYKWEGLLMGDDGASLQIDEFHHITVHGFGAFDGSANLNILGSNSGTNFAVTKKHDTGSMILTADSIEKMITEPRFIKPSITSGNASTNISCWVILRTDGTT